MTVARSVKVIAATAGRFAPATTGTQAMKRVVAYARASTDNE